MNLKQDIKSEVIEMLSSFFHVDSKLPTGVSEEQIQMFEEEFALRIPEELREWLRLFNGVPVGVTGIMGIPIKIQLNNKAFWRHPIKWLDLTEFYKDDFAHFGWKDKRWFVIAGDGSGNYYVLDSELSINSKHPIVFLEHERDYDLDYAVASGLWEFIRFYLDNEKRVIATHDSQHSSKQGGFCEELILPWPFDKNYVLSRDPDLRLLEGILPLPWEITNE